MFSVYSSIFVFLSNQVRLPGCRFPEYIFSLGPFFSLTDFLFPDLPPCQPEERSPEGPRISGQRIKIPAKHLQTTTTELIKLKK